MRVSAAVARIRLRHILFVVLMLFVGVCITGIAIAWKPSIATIQPPTHASFAAADIARGAELAALGDCAVCHTERNGPVFAGGRGVQTPFGTVYATNITPDPSTGIGSWSLPAFRRAMRDGIDREGHHLYPVLPYPHFIHATDDDIAAMYAFLMTRRPVVQAARPNNLALPFNMRPLLAGWNLFFLKGGTWQPEQGKTPEWNGGAYLVDAIGHCGACHTPHNALGAEEKRRQLTGGEAEGWYAPSLRGDRAAPRAWIVDTIETYLRTGSEASHGAAAGPMTEVTDSLSTIPAEDVHAIAVYIASLMPSATPADWATPPLRPVENSAAIAMFEGACGACHARDAPMTKDVAPSLALSTAVHAPTARDVVAIILHGLPWREGRTGPYMPAFAGALTDAQVATLAAYVRARYSNLPVWQDIEATVQDVKRQEGKPDGDKGGGS